MSCPCRVAQLRWGMWFALDGSWRQHAAVQVTFQCLTHHRLTELSELPTWTYCFFCPGIREYATYTLVRAPFSKASLISSLHAKQGAQLSWPATACLQQHLRLANRLITFLIQG